MATLTAAPSLIEGVSPDVGGCGRGLHPPEGSLKSCSQIPRPKVTTPPESHAPGSPAPSVTELIRSLAETFSHFSQTGDWNQPGSAWTSVTALRCRHLRFHRMPVHFFPAVSG